MSFKSICLLLMVTFLLVYFFKERYEYYRDLTTASDLLSDIPTGISRGGITAGPSITQSLAVYPPIQDIPSGNISRGGTTGGPSITQSLAVYRPIHKRDVGYRRSSFRTEGPSVQITCINPTITRMDECLEKLDKQVAEKCLPGFLKVLSFLQTDENNKEVNKGSHSISTNKTESCLRYVFSECSYDARFKVKTKLKKLIGVNLDIAFQEEFEMDTCNKDMMLEIISDVKHCLDNVRDNIATSTAFGSDKKNISMDIIQAVGQCIEDHTAFTCVLENEELFQNVTKELISMLKKYVLEILGKCGYENVGTCFKWLDYYRLESCIPDFFNYVQCLRNGTYNEELFKRVHKCFQDGLKGCSPSMVKEIMKILAGAVEGKSGEEPSPGDGPDEDDTEERVVGSYEKKVYYVKRPSSQNGSDPSSKYTSPDCSKKKIKEWFEATESCAVKKIEKKEDTEKIFLKCITQCLKDTRPRECSFYKASKFICAVEDINKLVVEIHQKFSKDKQGSLDSCLKDLKNPKLKDCIVKLFLYYVSLSHSHYTGDAREKLLAKAKLCFQVVLKNCPFDSFVEKLLRLYATLFKFKLPSLGRGDAVTKVTIPEGNIWCETRIITDEYTLPPTKELEYWPSRQPSRMWMTPTTTEKRIVPVTESIVRKTYPWVPTRIKIVEWPTRKYVRKITPTTVREMEFPHKGRTKWKTYPPPLTKIMWFTPRRTEKQRRITPTTVSDVDIYPITITMEKKEIVPRTRQREFKPTRPGWYQRKTRTTIIPYTFRPKYRTIIYKVPKPRTRIVTYTVPKKEYTKHVARTTTKRHHITFPYKPLRDRGPKIWTKIVYITQRPKIWEARKRPTTVATQVYEKRPRTHIFTRRPPLTRVYTYMPKPKGRERKITGTTMETFRVPIKVFKPKHKEQTTMKIKIKEGKLRRYTKHIGYATKQITYVPKARETKQEITKTTTERTRIPMLDCEAMPEQGPCKAHIPMWYYNSRTGKCCQFIYGGCGGNGNRYPTKEDCLENCKRVQEKPVPRTKVYIYEKVHEYEKGITPTTTKLHEFTFPKHYGTETIPPMTTRPWQYGPRPRFHTEKRPAGTTKRIRYPIEVLTEEEEIEVPSTMRFKIIESKRRIPTVHVGYTTKKFTIPPKTCEDLPERGPCNEFIEQWYYNPKTGKCCQFTYGGCGGNGNRYETKEYCLENCKREWEITPTTTEVTKIPQKPVTYRGIKRIPMTRIYEIPQRPKVYQKKKPRTTVYYYTVDIPERRRVITIPPQKEQTLILPPQHTRQWVPQAYRYTIPTHKYTDKDERTTMKLYIREHKGKERVVTKIIPSTMKYEIIYEKQITEKYPKPGTRHIYITVPPRFTGQTYHPPKVICITAHRTPPTTTKSFPIPHRPKKVIYEKYPPVVTEATIFPPPPRPSYKYIIKPTEVVDIRRPIKKIWLTEVMTPMTTKRVTIPQKPKEKQRTVPIPRTQWMKFTPPPGEDFTFVYTPQTEREFDIPVPSWSRKKIPPVTYKVFIVTRPPHIEVGRKTRTPVYDFEFPLRRKQNCYDRPERGPCDAKISMWYYSPKTGKCCKFTYGGCRGNGNRYTTEEECMEKCQKKDCYAPPEQGPCKEHIEMWYYNPKTGKCCQFIYGGCKGNGNRFKTKEECNKQCKGPATKKYTPKESEIYEKVTRTKVYTHRWPITKRTEEITAKPATVKIIIIEQPEDVIQHTPQIPDIPEYVFLPSGDIVEDVRTRTPTQKVKMTFPPKEYSAWRPTPKTRITEYTLPEKPSQFITPTTSKLFTFTFPHEIFSITYPPIFSKWFTVIPITPPPCTKKKTPTTTSFFQHTVTRKPWTHEIERPPTKKISYTPPHLTRTKEYHVSTKKFTFPYSTRKYECHYPTKKPKVKCIKQPTVKECTEESMKKWRKKIRNCTHDLLHKDNKTIMDFFEKPVKGLENYVIACVQMVGDTRCSNGSLQWLLEKEILIKGVVNEHAVSEHQFSEDYYYELKECIASISEKELEDCFPGLHKALTDLILYKKTDIKIKKKDPQSDDCLVEGFKRCSSWTRVTLEKMLMKITGTCIKINPPGKSLCDHIKKSAKTSRVKKSVGSEKCMYYVPITKLVKRPIDCIKRESKEKGKPIKVHIKLKIMLKCLRENVADYECPYKYNEKDVKEVINFLREFLVMDAADDDECKKNVEGGKVKVCYQNLEDLVLNWHEITTKDEIVNSVHKCLDGTLADCPDSIPDDIMEFVQSLIKVDEIISPPKHHKRSYSPSISSIKRNPSDVEICITVEGDKNVDGSPRPYFPDECVTYNDEDNPGKVLKIKISSCKEYDVDYWIRKIKECGEEQTTSIGLRNPDYLNLLRATSILMKCIDSEAPLICAPRYQEDFKRVIVELFYLMRRNSLNEDETECKKTMFYDKISGCTKLLHTYLVLTIPPDELRKNKEKSLNCLQNSLKPCDGKLVSRFLDLFELAMLKSDYNIRRYGKGKYDVCKSEEEMARQSNDIPSYMICGPGGRLRRRIKNYPGEQQSVVPLGKVKRSADPGLSMTKGDEQECTSADYKQYFEKMEDCTQRSLYLKFRYECFENDMIESWIAMKECMIENISDELNCVIKNENKMAEYLQYVSEVTHKRHKSENVTCRLSPPETRCYGTDAPKLHHCSAAYLQLVEARESQDHLFQLLNRTPKLLECLNSLWPNCSREISFMGISFLYLPLGMNYNLTITNGLKFASCEMNETGEKIMFPSCMDNENVNQIHSKHPMNSVAACAKCVRIKDGICSTKNKSEMFRVIKDDFSRVAQCLKNFIINESCLDDVTTRIKKDCAREFYKFSKSIKMGIITNSIEHFWKFNECLISFKSGCPESVKQFVPEIYFEVLGLNSVFKPLLRIFMDSSQ